MVSRKLVIFPIYFDWKKILNWKWEILPKNWKTGTLVLIEQLNLVEKGQQTKKNPVGWGCSIIYLRFILLLSVGCGIIYLKFILELSEGSAAMLSIAMLTALALVKALNSSNAASHGANNPITKFWGYVSSSFSWDVTILEDEQIKINK